MCIREYIYGKIIILDKDGTAKDVNLENAKSRYGYVPEAVSYTHLTLPTKLEV
ncbi:hypothetical protein JMUB7533_26760 [Staphylococcus aureus]